MLQASHVRNCNDKWLPDSSSDSSINGGHVLLTFPEQYTVYPSDLSLKFLSGAVNSNPKISSVLGKAIQLSYRNTAW